MRKYILSILFSFIAGFAVAEDNFGEVRVAATDFYKAGFEFLDAIELNGDEISKAWSSTLADAREIYTFQKFSEEGKALKKDFANLKDAILKGDSKEITQQYNDLKGKLDKITDTFEEYYKKKGDDNAFNDIKENIVKKYENLKSSTENLVEKANALYDNGASFNMPVGFEAEFGSVYVRLQLSDMEFNRSNNGSKGYTKAIATASITLPFVPKQEDESRNVEFRGDVFFKKSEPDQTSRIYLGESLTLPIIKNKVNLVLFGEDAGQFINNGDNTNGCPLHLDQKSYIEFNCNEITDVVLVGYFDFSGAEKGAKSNFLIATNEKGSEDHPEKHVFSPFYMEGKGGVSSRLCFNTPFKVKGLGDFVFKVEEGVVDFSDLQNPPNFTIPSYWTSPLVKEAWMGFYLKQLKILFPKEFFLNKKSESRTAVGVKDMYIDDYGFSGEAYIKDLVDKDYGNGGANISVNEISAKFLQGDFVGGKIAGSVSFPFLTKFKDSPEKDKADLEKESGDEKAILEKKDKEKNILKLEYSADVAYIEKIKKETPTEGEDGEATTETPTDGSENSDEEGEETKEEPEKYYAYSAKVKIGQDQKYRVPFTSVAYITVKNGAGLSITNDEKTIQEAQKAYGEEDEDLKNMLFVFTMNGELGVSSPKSISKGSNKLGFDLEFKNIPFEGLRFCNIGHPVDIDHIALNGKVGAKILGMSLAITKLEYKNNRLINSKEDNLQGSVHYGNMTDPKYKMWEGDLGMDARVELVGGVGGIGASLGSLFHVVTKWFEGDGSTDDDPIYNSHKWVYDGFRIGKIGLNADYSAFKLNGELDIFKDDEVFGNGFRGTVDMKIDPIGLGIGAQVCFGKTNYGNGENKYNYWFTRATAEMASTHILLFPPAVFLNSVTGGVYSKMNPNRTVEKANRFVVSDVRNYKPDPTIEFGFIAGIGIYVGSDNLAQAKAEMELTFSKSLALDQIRIGGEFSMIAPKSAKFKVPNFEEKLSKLNKNMEDGAVLSDLSLFNNLTSTKKDDSEKDEEVKADSKGTISGWVNMQYVRQTKKFLMNSGLKADLWGVITGEAYFDFYSEPGKWNMSLGTYDRPNILRFMNFAKCRSYFEMGHLSRYFYPPLSVEAAKQFGYTGEDYSDKADNLKNGKGFAFALDMDAGLDIEPLNCVYLNLYLNGGTDLLIAERPYFYDKKCRTWRASGDVYGSIGVKFGAIIDIGPIEEKIKIFHGSAFLGLQGELPAPAYGKGLAKFNASFGNGWFDVDKSYRVSFGKRPGSCDNLDNVKEMYDETK